MDDSLTLLRNLTWRSRLHGMWHQFIIYITGARYTAKLLRLAYQNIRVLQHFRRCREVEQLQPERFSRFWHLNFYRETFRQCLRLFSPVRSALPTIEQEIQSRPRRSKKKTRTSTSPPQTVATCQHYPQQQVSQLVNTSLVLRPGGFEGSLRGAERRSNLANASPLYRDCFAEFILSPVEGLAMTTPHLHTDEVLAKSTQKQSQQKRWKVRFKLQAWVLRLRSLPSAYAMKCKALLRIEDRKAQQRQFYQQAQLTLLQEQQRIAISTQTVLFLSLATAIDLKASRELTAVGQLVGKHRQHKTMTAEDLACFDQSLNALDGNHETVRVAVQ